jgi:hypothetical protein
MTLPDGDEFRPETEADDGDVDLFVRHDVGSCGDLIGVNDGQGEGQSLGGIGR